MKRYIGVPDQFTKTGGRVVLVLRRLAADTGEPPQ